MQWVTYRNSLTIPIQHDAMSPGGRRLEPSSTFSKLPVIKFVSWGVVGICLLFLAGCSVPSHQRRPAVIPGETKTDEPITIEPISPDPSERYADPLSNRTIESLLADQYRQWQGVPYRYGGRTKRGIDCSGFVQIAFREGLGIDLPPTTATMKRVGRAVGKRKLTTGDLVFFKTGRAKRHVGIYVGRRQFIHASTSQGVMRSDLDNPYWASCYWTARRILN